MITLPAHRSPLASSRQERGKAPRLPVLLSLLLLLGLVAGCSSAYYNTMEKLGVHKRDIMVDRVGEARDAQEATKEQFQSALEQFSQRARARFRVQTGEMKPRADGIEGRLTLEGNDA